MISYLSGHPVMTPYPANKTGYGSSDSGRSAKTDKKTSENADFVGFLKEKAIFLHIF
jgi:hypothetical protein